MILLWVTVNAGQKIGTLIDLASDTNYITHKAASRLNLRSEEITLVVHGVGGMKVQVETKRYLLKIPVKTPKDTLKPHQLVCYGLDSIADVHKHVTPKQLQKFFPDVLLDELVRPKEINLLISHREGQLAPQRIKAVGDLVLWDGPLGKTVGGMHPELFEELTVSPHVQDTLCKVNESSCCKVRGTHQHGPRATSTKQSSHHPGPGVKHFSHQSGLPRVEEVG